MQAYDDDTFEELAEKMDFLSGNFLAPECPLDDAGRFYEDYCDSARAHAILRIVVDADAEGFFSDLIDGAYKRRHYLARCAKAGFRDVFAACSRGPSFFDAVAADAFDLATEIGTLSPDDVVAGEEYEEDFCYLRFLHAFVRGGNAAGPELDALLSRFELALDGGWSSRLDVCRALRAGDGDAFTLAFESLLLDRQNEVRAMAPRAEEEVVMALDSQIFVEGLALLRLADREGLPTERQYPGCPAIARRKRRDKPIADILPAVA
jgi:hypothetical protein